MVADIPRHLREIGAGRTKQRRFQLTDRPSRYLSCRDVASSIFQRDQRNVLESLRDARFRKTPPRRRFSDER